ncbi:MAG TPA: SpoIIE family protein phosphatase [Spirochaetia bacterium]|nr:SpoIIE family protein phosphatase [Spirochaetia bacterium]
MVFGSIAGAPGAQLLVKLALSAVLVAFFLFLRGRETEGTMSRYALLGLFLALRDLAYALFPSLSLFRASDLILFSALLYLRAFPFASAAGPARRRAFALLLALPLAAALLLSLSAAFGLLGEGARAALWGASLLPVAAALALEPLSAREAPDAPGRELCRRTYLILGASSLAYLGAEALLGAASPFFQGIAAPLFYASILSVAFAFVDSSMDQLVGAVEHYEESIDSLYDLLLAAGAATKPDFSLQDVLDNMARVLVERTGAEGAIVLLADEFEEAVAVRALHGSYPPPFKLPESLPRERERVAAFVRRSRWKLGEGIFGEAARAGKDIFVPRGGEGLPDNGDEAWLRSGALVVSPLAVNGRVIGLVSLAKAAPGSFSERDFERCKLLASFASIAVADSFTFLEAAERGDIEREAAIAWDVQAALRPRRFPELPGLELAVFSQPARGVCSDYYDAIQTGPARALVAVGDVAGKGVAASLVMAMIRAVLHLVAPSGKDAPTILEWVNRALAGKLELDHFATMGIVAVDASSGGIELANAGHQPLIWYRASAEAIATVESKSVPLGVERGSSFPAKRFSPGPGDVLVMYTDGVVEAMSAQGKQYGRRNLGDAVQRSHALGAEGIASEIRDDLASFVGRSRQHDDQTVLVMKVLRSTGEEPTAWN